MHGNDEEPPMKRRAVEMVQMGGERSTAASAAGLDGMLPQPKSELLAVKRATEEQAAVGTRKRGAYRFASADWKTALLKGGISVVAFAALAGACVALIFAVNDVQVRHKVVVRTRAACRRFCPMPRAPRHSPCHCLVARRAAVQALRSDCERRWRAYVGAALSECGGADWGGNRQSHRVA